MSRIVFIALCTMCCLVHAADDKSLPAGVPPYGADKPLPVPQITQKTLANGLKVWFVKRQGFPKVDIALAVQGGNANDPADQAGVSGMLANLLTEGTSTRSSQQIAEALQGIGADLSAGADEDGIILRGDALRSNASSLIDIAADVARHPSFPGNEVELAKANRLQSLKAQEAQPAFQANRAFSASVYGEHPYHFSSIKPETVQAVTPAMLSALHTQRFAPNRALLVIGGDLPPADALAMAQKAFGDWKNAAATAAVLPVVGAAATRHLLAIDRPGSVQSTLRIGRVGIAANNAEAIPLSVANVILGGSFHSRITRNIREDKGYTYSPGFRTSALLAGGSITEVADVRSEVTGATINEVLYEFDRMGTTAVGEEELTSAKRLATGTYLFRNQVQGAVVGSLAHNWIVGLPPEYLAGYVPKVQAVTADQVRAVSRKYFAAKDQNIVVVGDLGKIADDLAQYGKFDTPKNP